MSVIQHPGFPHTLAVPERKGILNAGLSFSSNGQPLHDVDHSINPASCWDL